MNSKLILTDADGVLLDWEWAFSVWMRERGYTLTADNKKSYYLHHHYNELDEKWGAWYRTGTYIEHLGGPFRKFNFDEDKFTRKHNISMPKENSLLNFF